MKIKVIRPEMGYEGVVYKQGDVVEMVEGLAYDMIRNGLVVAAKENEEVTAVKAAGKAKSEPSKAAG